MASKSAIRPLSKLLSHKPASALSNTAIRRTITTSRFRPSSPQLQLSRAPIKSSSLLSQSSPSLSRTSLQPFCRRSYADVLAPKPRRRVRTTLRWLWRLTYLGAIGGLGYMGYTIYLLRTPQEQLEADPNKKTLVILGMCELLGSVWGAC